ncbi:MAG: oligosaccharide flippase family protein [Clostridia bacterium]|nr:oligosaccharide flippase family protein [Clostridia bacterium]
MKSNSSELKTGAFLSYIQMGLSILIGLFYTPVMIKLLGQNEYGLYNTVASTVAMLSALSLGFNSGYIKFFSGYKKNNDDESIYKLNGLFLVVFLIIGITAFVCGLFLIQNLRLVFDNGLTEDEYIIAKKLMLFLTVQLSLTFPLSVFSDIITAHEKFVFIKAVNIVSLILNPFVTLPLLLMGFKSMAVVSVGLGMSILVGALNIYYVFVKLKQKFCFNSLDYKVFKELFGYTFFIAINIVIDQINWKVDNVLLGRFCGTASVAVYSVGSTLNSYFIMFSTAISSVFTPRIHYIVAECKNKSNTLSHKFSELFIKVGRIQFIVLGLIGSGVVFFGKPFIGFWVGEDYENSYWIGVILIVSVLTPLIQNIGIEMQRALNKHRFRSLLYFGMALVNVLITVILSKKFGGIGAATGTAISLIIANGLVMNIYYYKKCGLDVPQFWKSILKMSLGLVAPVAFAITLNRFVDFDTILKLCFGIICYTVIYSGSMWIISMNDYEKDLIKSTVRKLRAKV